MNILIRSNCEINIVWSVNLFQLYVANKKERPIVVVLKLFLLISFYFFGLLIFIVRKTISTSDTAIMIPLNQIFV